uniref:Uncharacterized protein n=1 Tax=Arundo donax TaxID=35708 RepID=A0A0A9GQZ2_ARUDO
MAPPAVPPPPAWSPPRRCCRPRGPSQCTICPRPRRCCPSSLRVHGRCPASNSTASSDPVSSSLPTADTAIHDLPITTPLFPVEAHRCGSLTQSAADARPPRRRHHTDEALESKAHMPVMPPRRGGRPWTVGQRRRRLSRTPSTDQTSGAHGGNFAPASRTCSASPHGRLRQRSTRSPLRYSSHASPGKPGFNGLARWIELILHRAAVCRFGTIDPSSFTMSAAVSSQLVTST